MSLSRRQFLIVGSTATAGALAGCCATPAEHERRWLKAHPISDGKEALCLFRTARVPERYRVARQFGSCEAFEGLLPMAERIQIQRPEDLLHLHLEWINVSAYWDHDRAMFKIRDHEKPAYLIVTFPPQHLLEQGFPGQGNAVISVSIPVKVLAAGPTRLVFKVPTSYADNAKPYSFEESLKWDQLEPSVNGCALPPLDSNASVPPGTPLPGTLTDLQTSIELPWGLMLSPHEKEFWKHPLNPRRSRRNTAHAVRTELWHTTLTSGSSAPASVRAVDLACTDPAADYQIRPNAAERQALVHQTANFQIPGFCPPAVTVNRLKLSALGALGKLHVDWDENVVTSLAPQNWLHSPHPGASAQVGLDLMKWTQESIWGRDQYVELEHLGYLMPYGHPAVLTTIKQREWQTAKDPADPTGGSDAALLVVHHYCEILHPTVDYTLYSDGPNLISRRNCFKSVTLVPVRTPYLLDPAKADRTGMNGPPTDFTWMYLEGNDHPLFKFQCVATDWQDQAHHFELPLLWVSKDVAHDSPGFKNAVDEFNRRADYRTAELGGQRIAFVPPSNAPASSTPDTALPTNQLVFAVEERRGKEGQRNWIPAGMGGAPSVPTSDPSIQKGPTFLENPFTAQPGWTLAFFPAVAIAKVSLQAAGAFSSGDGAGATRITWANDYVSVGLPANDPVRNRLEIFADVFDANLDFGGDKSGGLCTPSMRICHLSRKFGLWGPRSAGGTGALGGGASVDFDPTAFFGSLLKTAKLIGGVELTEMIEQIENAAKEISRVPRLVAQQINAWKKDFQSIEQPVLQIKGLLEILSDSSSDQTIRTLRGSLKNDFQTFTAQASIQLQALLNRLLLDEATDVETALLSLRAKAEEQLLQSLNGLNSSALSRAQALIQLVVKDPLVQEGYLLLWQKELPQLNYFKGQVKARLDQIIRAEFGSRVSDLIAEVNTLVRQAAADMEALKSSLLTELKQRFKPELSGIDQQLTNDLAAAVARFKADPNHDVGALKKDVEAIVRQRAKQVLTNRINVVTSAVIGLVDGNDFISKIGQSLARLRDWSEAQLKQLLPDGDNTKKLLQGFQELFDMGPLVAVLSNAYNGVQKEFDELTQFPLPQLQALRATVERLISDSKDASKFLGDFTDALVALRNQIRALASGAGGGAAGPAAVSASDLKAAELARLTDIKTAAMQSIQAVEGKASVESKAIEDKVTKWFPDNKITGHEQILRVIQSCLDPKTGSLIGLVRDRITKQAATIVDPVTKAIAEVQSKLDQITTGIAGALNQVASQIDQIEQAADQTRSQLPTQLNFQYDWQPRLRDAGMFIASNDSGPASFSLSAKIRKSLNPGDLTSPPSVTIDANLERFKLHLIPSAPFLTVSFEMVRFVSVDGHKPDVTVKIAKVDFDDALSFVKSLAQKLSPNSGFFIEMADLGVEAGYRFALPAISTGAFNLMQVALVSSVNLPFNGDPVRVKFGLSERNRPFLLSVGILGGGGFFAITLSPTGVELLEGSLEFGAVIALDIGVASGRVSVTAGIYFSAGRDSVSLFGFVRAVGSLEILGLITIIVEFYLGLGYERRGNTSYAVGEALVHVEIDMTFFSIGVDLHYRKEFEGSAAPAGGGALAKKPQGGGDPRLELGEPIDIDACQRFKQFAENWSAYRSSFVNS